MDLVDGPVERRGAGRQAHRGEPLEPGRIEVGRRLHMEHRAARAGGSDRPARGCCSSFALRPPRPPRPRRAAAPGPADAPWSAGRPCRRTRISASGFMSVTIAAGSRRRGARSPWSGRRCPAWRRKPSDVGLGLDHFHVFQVLDDSLGPPRAPCGRSRGRDSPAPGASGPPGGRGRPGDRWCRSGSSPPIPAAAAPGR